MVLTIVAWDDRVACWWSVTPRSVGQADQYIVMISADFESFVACELSDGVHHVWWNCSNKLKCCVFGCLKKAALDNCGNANKDQGIASYETQNV